MVYLCPFFPFGVQNVPRDSNVSDSFLLLFMYMGLAFDFIDIPDRSKISFALMDLSA